jgi:mevalonate kinase
MLFSQKRAVIGLAALGIAAIGCSQNKVAQCNQLIEVANQAVTDVQAITENASPDDPAAFLRIADTAEQARTNLEAIELTDEQLQTYQESFIAIYTSTSESTRNLVEAVNAQDNQAAQQAYDALQQAVSEEPELVTEVNSYCSK